MDKPLKLKKPTPKELRWALRELERRLAALKEAQKVPRSLMELEIDF